MKMELIRYRGKVRALEEFCKDNSMEYEIFRSRYPLTLRIRPTVGYMQMSILEEDKPVNPKAALRFTQEDGEVHCKFDGDFSIAEGTFNKLKTLFKDIASFYAQYYFRLATTEPGLADEASRILAAIDAEDE